MSDALQAEIECARRAQEVMVAGGFIPLAEAARRTGVLLSTLADAARSGRLPAVQAQPRRWLVRLAAVEAVFGKTGGLSEEAVEQALAQRGVIARRSKARARLKMIRPVALGGEPLSETILADRR